MVSFELVSLENKKNIDIRPGYGLTAGQHNFSPSWNGVVKTKFYW
jgi:hypothetical protein